MTTLIRKITMDSPLYQQMRELRNNVLLRPLGLPDNSWEMHDKLSTHYVVVHGSEVIGCAVLVPSTENPSSIQIIQMAVNPDYQRKGIGKLLLMELIMHGLLGSLKQITCHAPADVVEFYKKLGFETYGEPFTEVGIPHNHMRLDLKTFLE